MRVIALTAVFLGFIVKAAHADVLDPAVQIQFIPEIKALYITPSSIHYSNTSHVFAQDAKGIEDEYGLYAMQNLTEVENNQWVLHPLEKAFELEDKKMTVILTPVTHANPNGMCGALIDANLTFIVNGKTILDNCPFIINQCTENDEMYKEKMAQSKCAEGLYYDIGDDMLVTKNQTYFNVSKNGAEKRKKHD